jgi:hypothetical protein
MSCSHDPLDLIHFAEGSAPAAVLPKIQAQIGQCRHCQQILAELLNTSTTLKQLRQPALPPVEIERWVHHLRRLRKPQPLPRLATTWLRRLRPAPLVALLALVLLIFSYRSMQHTPAVPANSQEELRLFLQEHAIAQDQGAFTTETISELLITENSRVSHR